MTTENQALLEAIRVVVREETAAVIWKDRHADRMQQGIASLNERLIDLTADVHRLHLIRETPEYKINALQEELAGLQSHVDALSHQTGASK